MFSEVTMANRTTIQIDGALLARLRGIVPPRGMNHFINEAIEEKISSIERRRVEREMIEGYLATQAERDDVARDWAPVDLEAWPE